MSSYGKDGLRVQELRLLGFRKKQSARGAVGCRFLSSQY